MKSIHTLILASKYKLDAIYPALLAVLNNIAPYLENIDRATSSKLINLFSYMSSPSFLLANETNHTLLQSLLESMNAIIEHQFRSMLSLALIVVKANKRTREFDVCAGHSPLEETI